MATLAQIQQYNFHKFRCGVLQIVQSTLEHRVEMGSTGSASPTGNLTYTGPGPATADLISTKIQVWAVIEPMIMRAGAATGEVTETGRAAIQMTRGQCPAIDDNGTAILISQDDILIDASGLKYRIHNPVITPDGSLWSFQLVRLR